MTTSFELTLTTALIAVLSAVVSLALGYPIGYWLASLGKSKRLITAILLVPFLLPAFLVGISFRTLISSLEQNSSIGILFVVLAHAFMNAGFIAVVTATSLVPREQIEAAKLDGASLVRIRWLISFPQQAPALSAAGLLVALYSATSYGLVISLGQGSIETLETAIVQAALQELDLGFALQLAGLQTFLTVGFFILAGRLGAKPTVLFGEES